MKQTSALTRERGMRHPMVNREPALRRLQISEFYSGCASYLTYNLLLVGVVKKNAAIQKNAISQKCANIFIPNFVCMFST